jgi:DNA topoisomerase-1
VLATIVSLLERTFIRIGNNEYARTNHSFGLTTLRERHVRISGPRVQFQFRGKSAKKFSIHLEDPLLAKIVKRCRDLPGYELFQYVDELGKPQAVDSGEVNAYLREIGGSEFSAKDFRTWGGTVLALRELSDLPTWDSPVQTKSAIARAVERVAERLGNTPAVCRNSYIHPAIINAYLDGSLAEALSRNLKDRTGGMLRPEESAVLTIITAAAGSASLGS